MQTALTALEELDPEAQARALNWLASALDAELDLGGTRKENNDGGTAGEQNSGPVEEDGKVDDPKTFLATKSPESDAERVTCLAYFLAKRRGQAAFTTKDLTDLNTEAAGRQIGNPSQAVADAVRYRSYLAPAGGGKRQVTRYGEEVIEALPDREKVKAITDKIPKKKRRKAKPKKAKK